MPIVMMLYALLFGGQITPLTQDELLTKANIDKAYRFQQHMNEVGQGETWMHNAPQSINADREIERHA